MTEFGPFRNFEEKLISLKEDSDSAYYMGLMEFGEMILKCQIAGMLSAVRDSEERHRYSLEYKAVRASGIGEWVEILDNILIGQSATHLVDQVREVLSEFTKKAKKSDWQYEAVESALSVLQCLGENDNIRLRNFSLRNWPNLFATIRNKARGHNFPQQQKISEICGLLEQCLNAIAENSILFNKLEWAFLSRNISGKYNVKYLGCNNGSFDYLKSSKEYGISDGIYVYWDEPRAANLMRSSKGTPDFFFPNGSFTNTKYETISYYSNNLGRGDASEYSDPPGRLPDSETVGSNQFDIIGNAFSNVPHSIPDYIRRPNLEKEIRDVLVNVEQYPIITLYGRGGIGKTSTAIQLARDISELERYEFIVWFSARDIDLQLSGPKQVNPQILTNEDISKYYYQLMYEDGSSLEKKVKMFCSDLSEASGPTLFIFDNFETVSSTLEIYKWLDTHVRLPNKVLITTRHKEFKGDFPIRVEGMERDEFFELVTKTSTKLGVNRLINERYKEELYNETSGHPYVAKILLGEVAKTKKVEKVPRIVASADEILSALFERTYSRLGPAAQRCFLTICGWKSLVPIIALEAVLLYSSDERFDVPGAIEDLANHSFVEIEESSMDAMEYVNVPLVASQFGQRKLKVSPIGTKIQADTQLLQKFGATQETDLRHGIGRNVEHMMRFFAGEIGQEISRYEQYRPLIDYICSKYPKGWLLAADILEEMGEKENIAEAKECVRRLLETADSIESIFGWRRLIELSRIYGDPWEEIDARMHIARMSDSEMIDVSLTANLVNRVLASHGEEIRTEEKKIIVTELAGIMSDMVDHSTTATDLSRLSWLYLNLQNVALARQYAEMGVSIEPNNIHCLGLIQRLST